jgi:hypothetical protein
MPMAHWGRTGEELEDVPLSARRGQMEPDASRAVENTGPELKLFGHVKYHVGDWTIIIVCIILDVILNLIHPFNRFVGKYNFEYDASLRFPVKANTVPFWAVPIIAILIPATVFALTFTVRRNTRDFHQALLGLLTAIAVTAVITDAIKDGVGRPRPDFFFRCFPDGVDVRFDAFTPFLYSVSFDARTFYEGKFDLCFEH